MKICYENNNAVGCGAVKEYEKDVAELKRMFVKPEYRRKGISSKILNELEIWAKEENFSTYIIETFYKLEKAISLHKSFGFKITDNYVQFIVVESSICMKKTSNI